MPATRPARSAPAAREARRERRGPAPPVAAGRARRAELWLHLHLPRLPLEVLTRAVGGGPACVLGDGEGRRARVLLTDHRAAALGIRPGMPLGAAHALGRIVVLERNPCAEQRALDELCQWALQFTSVVSPVPPDGLVLEIAGSLRLFDGLEGLLRRLRGASRELGFRVRHAVAPTPLAAAVLARARPRAIVLDRGQLPSSLAEVSLSALRLDPARHEALGQLGVRCLGDCRRLPRDGLARRLSPGFQDILDRLYGRAADPRPPFEAPQCFAAEIDLPWEVSDTRALTTAAERLLLALHGYLTVRMALTRRLCWHLVGRDGDRERFEVRLARAERDYRHMVLLLREALARRRLRAPVRGLGLRVDDLVPEAAPRMRDLFTRRTDEHAEAYAAFLDRLRARCGEHAPRGLGSRPEHRPERASCWRRPDPSSTPPPRGGGAYGAGPVQRPAWLLRQPLRLATRGGRPWLDGPLSPLAGRERIQSGWWDAHEVARDYFVAATVHGGRLWIYRELDGRRDWYLHGIFD